MLTLKVTYTSDKYDCNNVYKRYVRRDGNGVYYWCEVGSDGKFDHRQGTVDPAQLPEEVRDAADALCGYFPSYVDWPL